MTTLFRMFAAYPAGPVINLFSDRVVKPGTYIPMKGNRPTHKDDPGIDGALMHPDDLLTVRTCIDFDNWMRRLDDR